MRYIDLKKNKKIVAAKCIIISLIFSFFLFAWGLNIYECISKNEAIGIAFNLLFFTRQTGFLAIIYCIFILHGKNKTAISILGIIVNANFLIVNLVAWLGINSVIGWGASWIDLSIDTINHLILFILIFILWIITLSPNHYVLFNKKTRARIVVLYSSIILSIFFIPNLIINFIKINVNFDDIGIWKNGYFSVYGWLTNYNPNGGGHYYTLCIIPLAFLLFSLIGVIYTRINNSYFYKKRLFFSKNLINTKKVLLHIYICTLLILLQWITFIPVYVFDVKSFFLTLLLTNLVLTFAVIIYSLYLFIYTKFNTKIGYYGKIFFGFIILFSVIEFTGKICSLMNNTSHILIQIAKTCTLYGATNSILIIWIFVLFLESIKIEKNDIH